MKSVLSKKETVERTLNALRPVLEEIHDRADKGEAVSTKKMLMRRILRNHQIRFGALISKEMMSVFEELSPVKAEIAPTPVVVEEPIVVDSVDFDELTPEQQAEIEKQVAEDSADETTVETETEVEEAKPTSLKEAAKEIKKKKTKKA